MAQFNIYEDISSAETILSEFYTYEKYFQLSEEKYSHRRQLSVLIAHCSLLIVHSSLLKDSIFLKMESFLSVLIVHYSFENIFLILA